MDILVLGDSWASAVEADTGRDAGWPQIMGIPDTHRQGISGSTAAEWAADLDGRLTHAMGTQARCVIISLMGNDARAAVEDGRVTARELADALASMRHVVNACRRPRTVVLLYADPYGGTQTQSSIAVPIINAAIRAACLGLNVVYADTGAWLQPEHFDGRDIHPTRAGHQVIAERMRALCGEGRLPIAGGQ